MFTKYKGKEYKYATYMFQGNMKYAIGTKNFSFTDDTFVKSNICGDYFKIMDRSELSDIYDVEIYVVYDSGIPGVKDLWIIDTTWYAMIRKDEMRIVYFDGYLPGWEKVDRDTYVKWVKLSDITEAKIVFRYEKKDGIEYKEKLKEEKIIDVHNIEEYLNYYNDIKK